MKKKIVSILLCTAMVATMAVGCGGSGDSGSDSGSDAKMTPTAARTMELRTMVVLLVRILSWTAEQRWLFGHSRNCM